MRLTPAQAGFVRKRRLKLTSFCSTITPSLAVWSVTFSRKVTRFQFAQFAVLFGSNLETLEGLSLGRESSDFQEVK